MNRKMIQKIADELNLNYRQVEACAGLLTDGATIPFISRYRKERTGSMDEVQVAEVKNKLDFLQEVDKRRKSILKSLSEREMLTAELEQQLHDADTLTVLEDIFLPYKPKRRTRADIAREKGLEPLAKILMAQGQGNVTSLAAKYTGKDVSSVDEALQGARDIVAEWINENRSARHAMRRLFRHEANVSAKQVKKKVAENPEEADKYQDYFDFSEKIKACPAHRMLAIRRGETEGFLKVQVKPDEDDALKLLRHKFVRGRNAASEEVETAVEDCYKRLLQPAMETEMKNLFKEKADDESIRVFAGNLEQLLMAPPLGKKAVLAIDPGYRTGCKVVCLNEHGDLLHNETIYPHPPRKERKQAKKKISSLVEAFDIDAIAVGNGTASRETESFIKNIQYKKDVSVYMVSENGASIYSASPVARAEFPQYDVTVRGAVSIGRRLIDPLAELVKIDPKSIGIGQYQHDVDQKKLQQSLDRVVESCVNAVGVDLNTASKHLLTYVSGLGPKLAENVEAYRKENGGFASRRELKKVKLMGDKAYEQAAGFLRVKDSKQPLDDSAVHPESYHVVEKMAKDMGASVTELIGNKTLTEKISLEKYVQGEIGMPSLKDIVKELAKPGLDPRPPIKMFTFADAVRKIEDLETGMKLPGIVTNITRFGAFVDIGLKQNGLIHISNLADRFVSDPTEIVNMHQHVIVEVLSVDMERERIQLKLLKGDAEVG
ncbi:MAG: Tex family protein [Bacteroidota bacterium]|nr:Tex family protein [Bacteroidota bacterium]